ncbi:hypothetical protein Tco_0484384 [Tanacetum coccineum]
MGNMDAPPCEPNLDPNLLAKKILLIHSFSTALILTCDGASWSTVVEEGELVDAAGSGATTSAIGSHFISVGSELLCSEAIAVSSSKST